MNKQTSKQTNTHRLMHYHQMEPSLNITTYHISYCEEFNSMLKLVNGDSELLDKMNLNPLSDDAIFWKSWLSLFSSHTEKWIACTVISDLFYDILMYNY